MGEIDISIDDWTVTKVANFTSFLSGTTLSTLCYDRVTAAWGAQALVNTTDIHMGSSKYSDTVEHQNFVDAAFATNGSSVIDGGEVDIPTFVNGDFVEFTNSDLVEYS
jgi:hypothetical protein